MPPYTLAGLLGDSCLVFVYLMAGLAAWQVLRAVVPGAGGPARPPAPPAGPGKGRSYRPW